MFGRATIALGIGPHSSLLLNCLLLTCFMFFPYDEPNRKIYCAGFLKLSPKPSFLAELSPLLLLLLLTPVMTGVSK